MTRNLRRVLLALVVVVAIVGVWLVFVARNYVSPFSYRASGDLTLELDAVSGPRAWTRVTNVEETESEVRITVETLDWLPGPGTALGIPVELSVHLAEPLGNRVVTDGNGAPVHRLGEKASIIP